MGLFVFQQIKVLLCSHLSANFIQKLHTCEEGGAHLRIFGELEKQIFIKKPVEVGQ